MLNVHKKYPKRLFWEEGGQELCEPGGFVLFTGVGFDQMGHGLTDCCFVLKTRGREEKKEEGPNECEEKAETSQIPTVKRK